MAKVKRSGGLQRKAVKTTSKVSVRVQQATLAEDKKYVGSITTYLKDFHKADEAFFQDNTLGELREISKRWDLGITLSQPEPEDGKKKADIVYSIPRESAEALVKDFLDRLEVIVAKVSSVKPKRWVSLDVT